MQNNNNMNDQPVTYEFRYDDSNMTDDDLSYQLWKLVNNEPLFPLFEDNQHSPSLTDISHISYECSNSIIDPLRNSETVHISNITNKIDHAISKNLHVQNLLHQYYHKIESEIQITHESLKKLQKMTKLLISKKRKKPSQSSALIHITKHLIGWPTLPPHHWSWFIDPLGYVTPPPTLDSLQRQSRHSKYKTSIQIPVSPKWTNKEKKMLLKLVEHSIDSNKHSNSNIINIDDMNIWKTIASIFATSDFPRRHPLEYMYQWNNIIKNHSKSLQWSKDEEKLLVDLVQDTHRNWILVSERLNSKRTVSECFIQYQTISSKIHPTRRKWTKKEDEQLIQSVSLYGDRDWQQVASVMPEGRTGQQCMSRWTKSINPDIHHGKWTKYEDDRLIAIMNILGNHSDAKHSKWALISQLVPNRTDVQCRERWMNKLDPLLNEGSWTKEEDEKLLELVAQYGSSKWSWFAKHPSFVRRTDNQLRRRYRMLTQKKST